ncbi:cytochrome P450 2U1 [Trichonephila inaurata madagascariensis]|uniref:Cytochrome P450 2U1 n=1 Tax=Trichonephila inaurata madagascariensis TaxID=2747483 RepID=A0A8X7C2K9_9ARAC|nr:cytochrome P450 2U1 [Trichonephila inaurata madagascariensis]
MPLDERLRANAFNIFFEGTESTSLQITSLLLELSKHPEVQKAAQDEIDAVIGRERLPSWLDKQNLPYVDATLQLFRLAMVFRASTMYSNFGVIYL